MFDSDWLRAAPQHVPPEWIDYNGHMNLAYYVMAFDRGLDEMLDEQLGAGPSLARDHGMGPFALQNHVHYLGELRLGDVFHCQYLMLDGDPKRVHIAGEMYRRDDPNPVCVMEQVLINVDHQSRKSVAYPIEIYERITAMVEGP